MITLWFIKLYVHTLISRIEFVDFPNIPFKLNLNSLSQIPFDDPMVVLERKSNNMIWWFPLPQIKSTCIAMS